MTKQAILFSSELNQNFEAIINHIKEYGKIYWAVRYNIHKEHFKFPIRGFIHVKGSGVKYVVQIADIIPSSAEHYLGSEAPTLKIQDWINRYKEGDKDQKSAFVLTKIDIYDKDTLSFQKTDGSMVTIPPQKHVSVSDPLDDSGDIMEQKIEEVKPNFDEEYTDMNEKYDELKNEGRIVFVTFHPALSYEEFVEGVTFNSDKSEEHSDYLIKEGIFKVACSKALYLALKADDVEVAEPKDYTKNGTWKSLYQKYTEHLEEINSEDFETFWKEADFGPNRVVVVIDEINRGEVAKIFGELITFIEEDKRLGAEEEGTCILPISRDTFAVPRNVYIIGTMNTADRSLVQLDVALRRRFSFESMWPKLDPSKDECDKKLLKILNKYVAEADFLISLNGRILKISDLGPDKLIGHSYLFEREKMSVQIWLEEKIIPLVYEYSNGIKENFLKVLFGDEIPEDRELDENWYKFNIVANKLVELNEL